MNRIAPWARIAAPTSILTLFLLASALGAAAGPAPALASTPQHWSYSYQAWDNRSGNHTGGHMSVSYSLQAYRLASYDVTATNTSATTTELMGVRNLTFTYDLVACEPNCTTPTSTQNVSISAGSQQVQFLNFTSNATVEENGTPAAALGITNASSAGTSHLSEKASGTFGNRSYAMSRTDSEIASFSVMFSPALGLIPWNLSTNLTWNSSSSYRAAGGWNDSSQSTWSYGNYSMTRNGSFAGTVNRTGNESVWGIDWGTHTNWHNVTSIGIGLRFHGPFDFDNGLFMTAIGSDLFQGATANWSVFAHPGFMTTSDAVTTVWAEHAPAAAPTSGSGSSSGSPSGSAGTPTSGSSSGGSPPASSGLPVSAPTTLPTKSGGTLAPLASPTGGPSPMVVLVLGIGTVGVLGLLSRARLATRPKP